MKVLILNGSPKKKSDTFRMTDAFLKGLNRAGEHEVNIINVIDKKVAPCQGCFGCWQKMDGHCVIQDDQNAILDLYRDADVIIWSFPLYCYGMSSHLKAVLDRTIPLNASAPTGTRNCVSSISCVIKSSFSFICNSFPKHNVVCPADAAKPAQQGAAPVLNYLDEIRSLQDRVFR